MRGLQTQCHETYDVMYRFYVSIWYLEILHGFGKGPICIHVYMVFDSHATGSISKFRVNFTVAALWKYPSEKGHDAAEPLKVSDPQMVKNPRCIEIILRQFGSDGIKLIRNLLGKLDDLDAIRRSFANFSSPWRFWALLGIMGRSLETWRGEPKDDFVYLFSCVRKSGDGSYNHMGDGHHSNL